MIASVLSVAGLWAFFFIRGSSVPNYTVGGTGVMPVAVLVVVSSAVLVVVSLATEPPSRAVIERFFPPRTGATSSR